MQGVLAVSGKAGFALAVGWRLEADFDVRVPFRQLLQNGVNFLFLVEDEVGKFFFPVHEDQAVIIVGRAVIRLAFADPAEGAVNIGIGHIVLFAEVPVIEAELSQCDAADRIRFFVILYMRIVIDPGSVWPAEPELP